MQSLLSTRLVVGLTLIGTIPAALAAESNPEEELKAAIVLSFVRFAEWPHAPSGTPITIAVFGQPSFAQVLRRTMEGRAVMDRPLRVVELKSAGDLKSCDLIYLAGSRGSDIRSILADPRLAHALTLGEAKDFLEMGGAVNLLVVDGHMSFEVSLDVLERTGITISSKLLRLGQIRGRRRGES